MFNSSSSETWQSLRKSWRIFFKNRGSALGFSDAGDLGDQKIQIFMKFLIIHAIEKQDNLTNIYFSVATTTPKIWQSVSWGNWCDTHTTEHLGATESKCKQGQRWSIHISIRKAIQNIYYEDTKWQDTNCAIISFLGFQKYMWVTVGLYFYEAQQQAKLIYQKSEMGLPQGGGVRETRKEDEGIF